MGQPACSVVWVGMAFGSGSESGYVLAWARASELGSGSWPDSETHSAHKTIEIDKSWGMHCVLDVGVGLPARRRATESTCLERGRESNEKQHKHCIQPNGNGTPINHATSRSAIRSRSQPIRLKQHGREISENNALEIATIRAIHPSHPQTKTTMNQI